jgi:uncharacterized membrane protein (DUF485 family)
VQHRPIAPEQWDALAAEPEFRQLLRARRSFTIPSTIFFIAYYLALPLLVGFEPALMSRPVWGPLTLAYAFALSEFAMAWLMLALYLRRARDFDDMAARVAEHERQELQA